ALQNVRYECLDVERDSVNGSFDLIVSMAVFQFISDIEALLRKLWGALEPSGKLILQLPTEGKAMLMRLPFMKRSLPDFKEARGAFTESEIRTSLAGAGFEVESIKPIIKGPTILAKELFYFCSSIHPSAAFAVCPLLNWVTVCDKHFRGHGQGLFVISRKA